MGGRVALVTGGSRGIGAATARALAADGHRVAICARSDAEGSGAALAVQADVTDAASIDAAFAAVEAELGPVEILVNNAGITRDGLLVRMGDDQWRDVLRTNLDGAFVATRRALPGMMKGRFGRIVHVASVAGAMGSAGQANYAAAKAGLVGFGRSVAREMASRSITSNVVEPGPIATAMTDELPAARRADLAASVPLGRFGTAEEVAALIAFLCSDAAGFITGAVVPVDGGLSMGR
ncbi:MAG TPA: 3-oxoacyl-ACP reductase FabG [Acidimicrobiales bacterium]|nr:3-oxoacyl-ACP reductase FabG [Acidimicrobiales bacterium]